MRRRSGLVDIILAVLLVAALVAVSAWLAGEEVAGAPRIVDGDTLAIEDRRIRLSGIDAPELAQTCERASVSYRCGEAAREGLRALVTGHVVACRLKGRDQYGRDLATCLAGEADLGAALVRRGFAVAFGRYEAEERAARADRAGLWAGTFQRPSAWRREHRPAAP